MKTLLHSVPALLALCLSSTLFAAGRISEPDTVFYGRIVQRLGAREFPLTAGELVWTLRTTGPGGRDSRFTTQLQPLADGRYSYRLAIHHQVLAYDLTVNAKAVALSAAGGRVQHVSVTLDGIPLTVAPAAVDGFALDQSSRAGTQRIDLELNATATDSDGDGLPDWWEDANGFDKWNPRDATNAFPPGTYTAPPGALEAKTFAEWRAAWFPQDTRDLNTFGTDDFDRDAIPNVLEYAFDLDPKQADASPSAALPHAVNSNGRLGVAFRKRANATDLTYQVDISEDLFRWRDGTSEVEELLSPTQNADSQTLFVERSSPEETMYRFFRVRVNRQ